MILFFIVYFLDPSRVLLSPADQTVGESYNVTLYCYVEGKPKPQVQWLKNGQAITQDNRITISQPNLESRSSSTLTITNVGRVDAGKYSCNATNSFGSAVSTQASLNVHCKL